MDEQQRINAVASSSNSSSMVSSKTYDVFLSFRGEDTRKNFTSHLYKALNEEKVETYIDNQLEKGDEISPALIKAIEDSHISIVIFSENYASSKWCLGELSKILECRKDKGQIVIPVFYNMDPSHVRRQTGSYEQAFAKHWGEPRCNKWKDALTEVANLVGLDSRTYRTDHELLKDIVGDVLRKLAPRYRNQRKGLVGIEEHYKQIESLLKIGSNEVKILGIWGMGGIGKTTLATALYDKLSYEFEGRCFLANVMEKSDKLKDLRDELFSMLSRNKNHGFDNFDMSRLRRKKVFIVLDDVATSDQFEKLIVEYDFLGPGSRVIVTTRNKQILSPVDEIYQVEELSSNHSFQLFCLTVFGEKQPKEGYEDLSKRVVSYCKGIPLALKVLGASLRTRSKEAWECELRKLGNIPNLEINNVLKLSYDGLDHSQKDIFLDIACFFKGWGTYWVTRLLEAFGFFPASGIEVLLDKALITISYDKRIEMHDLIQEMGWEIVHQESIKDLGRRSRLWKHEEVHDVLKYNRGTNVVEGITLDLQKLTADLYLSSNSLAKMTNLRFLQIHGWYRSNRFHVYLPNGLESLSEKLRYLHWDGFCLEHLPSNFCAEQLVELHMPRSKIKKLWGGVQNLVNLKTIDLFGSQDLIEIPDVSKAEKLERVSLGYCESLRQLLVHSKSLRELNLYGCSSLKEISVTSEKMTQLDLSDTAICALSLSMLSLPKLTHLCLDGCKEIESLNVHLKSLCKLDLNGCSSLKEISVTSEEMTELNLSDTAICALPSSIGHLLSLQELDLSRSNVESLPANIKNLTMLTKLKLDDCRKLVSLPELPQSMRGLYLNDCRKLMSLPKLPPSLYEVSTFNCTSLETDITQWLVLQHILQSRIPNLHDDEDYDRGYFIFPGDHVTDECGFCTAESSITIPYLPKSHLCAFIYCVILSEELLFKKYVRCRCSTYQDGIKVEEEGKSLNLANLISDHVLFWYHDASKFDRIHFNDISFIFELEYYDGNKVVDEERIKGCGVFPVYATASGLKLLNSSNKEIFELESISDNESQPTTIGIGGSNNENEDDWEQLLEAKRRRTSPEMIIFL